MKRRQGFTLVEMLVCMALIMFMMAILSQAFMAATGVFRNLKAAGDMAEKLRASTQLLQRDLAADHFDGKKRLSDPYFWQNGPPQQGFFQILQGGPAPGDTLESADPSGINSYRATNHSLAFTIKLRGNQMSDFLTASAPPPLLAASANFGPPESRYQLTSGGSSYNYQWAEVVWFMVAQLPTDVTVTDPTTGAGPQQLYTLYRRQRLLVPDNSLVQPTQPAASLAQYLELSCWANGGNLYFNSPIDITDPQRRFGKGVGAYTTIAQDLAGLGVPNSALAGSDIQLTNVLSFDVRILPRLPAGTASPADPFVTLFQAPFTSFNNGNPSFGAAMVFDTWTSLSDGLNTSYANWNVPNQPTSIPLWTATPLTYNTPYPSGTNPITVTGSGPIIQAIQISIRIWDQKTNQTREVTIVQAM